jgi:hypothetical protein
VSFEQILIPITVGRVAPLDQAIQNQIGGAAGQEDLVPVLNVPTPLDDDVGMLLEKETIFSDAGTFSPLMTRRTVWSMTFPRMPTALSR